MLWKFDDCGSSLITSPTAPRSLVITHSASRHLSQPALFTTFYAEFSITSIVSSCGPAAIELSQCAASSYTVCLNFAGVSLYLERSVPAIDFPLLRKVIPSTANGKGEAVWYEANTFSCQLEHELHGFRTLRE